MNYVDGFVATVSSANREAYRKTPRRRAPFSRSTGRCASWNAGATTSRRASSLPSQRWYFPGSCGRRARRATRA